MDPMVFDDPAWAVVPVRIGSKDYELREATEGATLRYRDAKMANAHFQGDALVGFVSAGAPSVVVGECLFEKGKDTPVGAEWVRKNLRPQIVTDLLKKLREISPGLDGDTAATDEQAKKGPTAAGTSS